MGKLRYKKKLPSRFYQKLPTQYERGSKLVSAKGINQVYDKDRKTIQYDVRLMPEIKTFAVMEPYYALWIARIKLAVEDVNGIAAFGRGPSVTQGVKTKTKVIAQAFLDSEFCQELVELLGLEEYMKAWAIPKADGGKHTLRSGLRKEHTRRTPSPDQAAMLQRIFKKIGVSV